VRARCAKERTQPRPTSPRRRAPLLNPLRRFRRRTKSSLGHLRPSSVIHVAVVIVDPFLLCGKPVWIPVVENQPVIRTKLAPRGPGPSERDSCTPGGEAYMTERE